jgi:hypothetical protein
VLRSVTDASLSMLLCSESDSSDSCTLVAFERLIFVIYTVGYSISVSGSASDSDSSDSSASLNYSSISLYFCFTFIIRAI